MRQNRWDKLEKRKCAETLNKVLILEKGGYIFGKNGYIPQKLIKNKKLIEISYDYNSTIKKQT